MKNMEKTERLKREMDRAEEIWEKMNEHSDIRVEGCYVFDNMPSKQAAWKNYRAAERAYFNEIDRLEKKAGLKKGK